MALLLSLDQGTTSSRAILFDEHGRVRASAQQTFEQIFPQPGWVEHDPEQIWATQKQVMEACLADHPACRTPGAVAAMGIANQRETTVVWDRKTGRPIYNAIVWQDRRTAEVCERLRADGLEETVRDKTGLLLDPYFSATKIGWILDHVPGARERAEAGSLACGTIDTWLVWKLTNGTVHITDPGNASRTLLFNIHDGDWDEDLLQLFSVPRALLPKVRTSSEVYGEAQVGAPGVPIAGIAGDQQAALFGQACFQAGQAKNTYGTGCFLLLNTGTKAVPSTQRMLTTVARKIGDRTEYALEGSVFIGGAAVQWLRDGLGLIQEASEVGPLAASVPDNGGVYFVPALVGLGAPHWDPYARGTLIGLTRGTRPGHIARAALEGIAFQVADVLDAMSKDADLALETLRVDGGACANDLLLQIQADVLGVSVLRPQVTETTALGVAYLAGLAVGVWQSRQEIAQQWALDTELRPVMSRPSAEALRAQWSRAVERSKNWAK